MRAAPVPTAHPASAPVTSLLDPALEPVRGRSAPDRPYRADLAAFVVRVGGAIVPHGVLAVTVLPGGALDVEAEGGSFVLHHDAGRLETDSQDHWTWRAPTSPGVHALEVARADGSASVHLNVLVLHPRSQVKDGRLNGFRMGAYREEPLDGKDVYLPPKGFVEVAHGDEDILVSPHFTLGQFLCKQDGEPRYLALSTPLLIKLEAVLDAANRRGITTGSFQVMSGFRTPWYNRAIGNTTSYSRHLWGDAADIYVDVDRDGDMDDLDGNGRHDVGDARVLAAVVESVERNGADGLMPGGLGIYRRNAAHGPFVHVDARGYQARW